MSRSNSHSIKEKYKMNVLKKGILPLSLSIILLSVVFMIGYLQANAGEKALVLIINIISIVSLSCFLAIYIKDYLGARGFELSEDGILLPTFTYYKSLNKSKVEWNEILCIFTNPHKDFISIILTDDSRIDIFKEDIEELQKVIEICGKYVNIKDADCNVLEGCKC